MLGEYQAEEMAVDSFLVEKSEAEERIERIWILPYKLVAIGSMVRGIAVNSKMILTLKIVSIGLHGDFIVITPFFI